MTSPTPLIPTLETYLKLTEKREQAISANMANVDTPGYHTKDINFEAELAKALSPAMSQSEYGSGITDFNPVAKEVPGLLERPDGNNVNMDREGLMMSETQLQYQIGISMIKHEFHGLLSAINGGGGN